MATDTDILRHASYHVFLPPELPQAELGEPVDCQVNCTITESIIASVRAYTSHDPDNSHTWDCVVRMLEGILHSMKSSLHKTRLSKDLLCMKLDEVLVLYIRAQNAAVMIRKRPSTTIFEVFEVQPQTAEIMSTPGKIVRSYPGPAAQIPNSVAEDGDFVNEVANFLTYMDTEDIKEAGATIVKAGSEVREVRDSTNPNYFSQLFLGILRGIGEIVEPPRVTKRIADEVLWHDAFKPWRRSPIWLVIRVAIETALGSRLLYKSLMLFSHAKLLQQCLEQPDFPSDLLYAMRVKLARRLAKLGESTPEFVAETVLTTASRVEAILQARWSEIQMNQARSPEWDPLSLDQAVATNQSLVNSRDYLIRVFQGRSQTKNIPKFTPEHPPRLYNVTDFTSYARDGLTKLVSKDKDVALLDFESSVYDHLSSWTNRNLNNAPEACRTVLSCFDQYLAAAQTHYNVDVADHSIMILTLMKLWVAIDQLATEHCKLLGQFSPEIPERILEPLLLRTSQHIDHARIIQQYLQMRHGNVPPQNLSIFSETLSQYAFAVQYFRNSPSLQSIKESIEEEAKETREAKLEELEEKNNEYARLDLKFSQLDCTYVKQYNKATDEWSSQHTSSCERCRIKNKRDNLKIVVHEWPLSSNTLEAEATVFELNRSDVFAIWRDITYRMLRDLGNQASPDPAYSPITLEVYSGLRRWLASGSSAPTRIIMASSTKSFLQSHYSGLKLPADKNQVCVNNGLKLRLYDKKKCCWATGPFGSANFKAYGTFSLPEKSSYRHLHFALEGTTHTSNMVLADQYKCLEDISLHEHIAFGTLRGGGRLQWMNIVRGLSENILTFRSKEVHLLHLQAAWQLGPTDNQGHREWHEELRLPDYAELLIAESQAVLDRVKASWLEAYSLSTVVRLVIRLMSSSASDQIIAKALGFLRGARYVAFGWVRDIQSKLKGIHDSQIINEYQNRLCETAVICRSTYDVDPCHMPKLLVASEDLIPLIACSIIIYDNKPPALAEADKELQVYLCRDRRLAHKMLPFIHSRMRSDPNALCPPVQDLWSQYRPNTTGWDRLLPSDGRWVQTYTLQVNNRVSQTVHLNLLEGRLLIDSKPLGRLPRSYIQHSDYIRVFGQTILEVVPSSSPGMDFATRDCVNGYEVSFLFVEEDEELVIQAYKDEQTYELVPFSRLENDLPELFLVDYHHWAHLEGKCIELRPLLSPWSPDPMWILSFTGDISDGPALMSHGNDNSTLLIDIHSRLFSEVSSQLSPLESSRYLHITKSTKPANKTVEIELPRMKLSFFLNNTMRLESHNFRGHVVDRDQSSGTMFGLMNALVLRNEKLAALKLPRSRSLLIPYGKVQFTRTINHVKVTINSGTEKHVQVYRYLIDTDLGFLANDAGLTSRLFGIYLHALTSHCLPDRLTGRTGTEEALSLLSEPATSSFERLDRNQSSLLHLIGLLTPNREYYPAHLEHMQTVHWLDLPTLSQHYAYSLVTESILKRAKILELFRPLDNEMVAPATSMEATLHKRIACRSSSYYPSAVSLPLHGLGELEMKDVTSVGRENLSSERVNEGHLAAWAAKESYRNWGKPVYAPRDISEMAEQLEWKSIKRSQKGLSLTYSPKWLKIDVSENWITLYDLCRRAPIHSNKYCLAICLASAAFGKSIDANLLPVLIAFATIPDFSNVDPPTHASFSLADGCDPTKERVREIVASNARPKAQTPAGEMQKQEGEKSAAFKARKHKVYRSARSKFLRSITSTLYGQRSSEELRSPPDSCSPWFNLSDCVDHVSHYFSSCKRNTDLRKHFTQVKEVLSLNPTSQQLSFARMGTPISVPPAPDSINKSPWGAISLEALMDNRPFGGSGEIGIQPNIVVSKTLGPMIETNRLAALFSEFASSSQRLNRQYGKELDDSRKDLEQKEVSSLPKRLPRLEILDHNCQSYYLTLKDKFDQIAISLGPSTSVEKIMAVCDVWPRITPRTLLQQLTLKLRPTSPCQARKEWQKELLDYARLFVDYQQSQRLVHYAQSKNVEEFWKEFGSIESNSTCEGGTCSADWLLVQIAGNFRMRSVQIKVAEEMILPSSGSNTVFQLNMGEGKSSVIVPVIAASLANGERLVRVVVLKPLWHQMFQLLVSRLASLVNRRVYYLPFARNVPIGDSELQNMEDLLNECIREGGILLAQPEHILSFKLMVVDRLIDLPSKPKIAERLRRVQGLLTEFSRDILDESDEILHVRYQLVYTVGHQTLLENHPSRWTITQELLNRLEQHISHMGYGFSQGIHYEKRAQGRFPAIRIMSHCNRKTEDELISALANDIILGNIQSLNCARILVHHRSMALELLTAKDLSYANYNTLKGHCGPSVWGGLLVARGLLASGILVFALKQKLYRVDYGLDLRRSPLAVPFRAKDIPSLRAEFGHPDVTVTLTCLSYYYKGLSPEQLENCFSLLYRLDNPSQEYETWTARIKAPTGLCKLSGVNIRDRKQFMDQIIPTFSHNSAVIDFFLAYIVFPKAARSFPHKLSTSGWDLAEPKPQFTTGFSGTNDSRYLLPTSIIQTDPVGQLSTNALVLTYLLRPENNSYTCMRGEGNRNIDAEGFLDLLVQQEPEVRVLLDVGAQMLELENEELVRSWLGRTDASSVEAAVYFNDQDQLVVMSRDGPPSSFYSSPYSEQLGKCIVYLDDGHTRGTDLKLPQCTRALVTLGPKVTKDRLYADEKTWIRAVGDVRRPPEVDTQVRRAAPHQLDPDAKVDTLDILRWAMLETCRDLQHHVSRWAQQGVEYSRRAEAQRLYNVTQDSSALKDGWVAPETRSLEQLYGVLAPNAVSSFDGLSRQAYDIPMIRERLESLGINALENPGMDEEQEREVSYEVEQEVQVQRP